MALSATLQKQYFSACLLQLPGAYSSLDTNRLTLVHFCCHALDLLGAWDDSSTDPLKSTIIDWVYSLQVPGGFIGGQFLGERTSFCDPHSNATRSTSTLSMMLCIPHGHIAMNYTALTILRLLGDDWSRLNRAAIIAALPSLQLPNGSFACVPGGSESDIRFLYCACCVSHMLNDWSGVNIAKAVSYIQSCKSFDGAMGLLPGQEGHGGSTFCAVASLTLMQQLDPVLNQDGWKEDLIHWCVRRQVGGMQGRPNKDEDTCYSFWIGGTLRLLNHEDLLHHDQLRDFVFSCQTHMGGFSKMVDVSPDLLHAYYSLAYLSMSQHHLDSLGLKDINCALGVSMDTATSFAPCRR